MIKAYDVICKECENIEEQWINTGEEFEKCSKCGGEMKRLYTNFNFKLKYDPKKDSVGWSFNNYERSKYWDEMKQARSEGRAVRPINEK